MNDNMDNERETITASVLLIIATATYILRKSRRKKRRFGIRNIYKRRLQYGEYHHLVQEMFEDHESFFQYFRMTAKRFDSLLTLIGPHIKRYSFRTPLSEGERLAITLRYLASSDSQISLSFHYRVSQAAICKLLRETCAAVWQILQPIYLKVPTTAEWSQIENDFRVLWNFPNCIGAMDGKHCVIQAPNNSGSDFYNYKGSFSMVLLAVSDANYCFRVVSIGEMGRKSDGGVFNNSSFGKALTNGSLDLPQPKMLPGTESLMPHVFVCDEAFPLRPYMMRPYPGRNLPLSKEKAIFNYRLSRARRVVENSFGILAARWRIFRKPIIASVETVEAVIKATVVLHNFLKLSDTRQTLRQYCPPGFCDHEDSHGHIHAGEWRSLVTPNDCLHELHQTGSNMYCRSSKLTRDEFATYFCTLPGEVPWQLQVIQSGTDS